MTDAIDLLDAIGRDPSLRYAAREYLAAILAEAKASEGLVSAAATGDSSLLAAEFGARLMQSQQGTQTPGDHEHDHDHDHDHDHEHDHDHDHDHDHEHDHDRDRDAGKTG